MPTDRYSVTREVEDWFQHAFRGMLVGRFHHPIPEGGIRDVHNNILNDWGDQWPDGYGWEPVSEVVDGSHARLTFRIYRRAPRSRYWSVLIMTDIHESLDGAWFSFAQVDYEHVRGGYLRDAFDFFRKMTLMAKMRDAR